MKHKLILAALALVPFTNYAADAVPEKKSPFTASAELGALHKTGNTKTSDILAGFDAFYKTDVWKNTFNFDLLIRKSEKINSDGEKIFQTSDQKWRINLQSNYTLGQAGKNYVYGSGFYEEDRFNGFEKQWSISSGLGRRWYETKVASFDADVGPGYKRDVLSASGSGDTYEPEETRNSVILQAQALYVRKLNEHVELRQTMSAKYAIQSGENSVYRAETSITTKLISTLQLKFSFRINHNTKVDAGKANTETQTAVTLVYSF